MIHNSIQIQNRGKSIMGKLARHSALVVGSLMLLVAYGPAGAQITEETATYTWKVETAIVFCIILSDNSVQCVMTDEDVETIRECEHNADQFYEAALFTSKRRQNIIAWECRNVRTYSPGNQEMYNEWLANQNGQDEE